MSRRKIIVTKLDLIFLEIKPSVLLFLVNTVLYFIITLIPMVLLNIALTIGPPLIGPQEKLLKMFAQVIGAVNTILIE